MAASSVTFQDPLGSKSWADAADEASFKCDTPAAAPGVSPASSMDGWEESKTARRGNNTVTNCSGPFGMSTSRFRELYDLFTEKALGSLDVGGRSYKHFLDSSRKLGDNIYVIDGQRWDAKSRTFIQGSSWTDLFFIEHPVLGVTKEPDTGFRHYKREHSLASLIINGRDLTASPEVQLGNLESYLPEAKNLKERVMSRFNEIISSSFRGTRKVELNQKLDHRVIAVTITMCVSTKTYVSLPPLSAPVTTAPVPSMLQSIWSDTRSRVASPAAPVVTHSPQVSVVEPTVRETPTAPVVTPAPASSSSALSEEQRKLVLERIISTLGNDPSKASAVILAVLG
jgi:hypothetical protein